MLTALPGAPRPPAGVALLGLFITALSSTLRLLPYIMICCMIVLSLWVPSHPAEPEPVYGSFPGRPKHIYSAYKFKMSPSADKTRLLELSASQRILVFLLAIPVTSIFENVLFRPARDFFLQTVEFWYDLRYIQPAQATGSWPDTWTPILNALRSIQFVAEFTDGVVGNDHGPRLTRDRKRREADMLPPSSDLHVGGSGSISFQKRPAIRIASSSRRTARDKDQRKLDRKQTSSLDPVGHGKGEDSPKIPRIRKTFISPPRVSSSSPWVNCGSGVSSSTLKNLSRVVGITFHYPPPRKPVLRPNIRTRALLSRSSNAEFERLSHSTLWVPISNLDTSTCAAVVPWPNFTKIHDKVGQVQLMYLPETVQLPYAPQLSHTHSPTHPQSFISRLQEERPIQPLYTPFPAFHPTSYPEHHISVYESPLNFPELPNAAEPSFERPKAASGSIAIHQQPSSEHMDVDCPRLPTVESLQMPQALGRCPSTSDSCPPAYIPPNPSHDQSASIRFSGVSQPQFSNHVPGTSSPHRPFPYSQPVVEYISTASDREGHALSSILPAITTSASHSIFSQPLNYHKDFAITHPDFSCHPAPSPPPCYEYPESTSTREVMPDTSCVWQSASTEYAPAKPVDQNICPSVTAPVSSSRQQPETIPRPSSPVDSVRAIVGDDSKDASGSKETDSDNTSDSDYTESSSDEDDSDSESGLSDLDEEEIIGPSGRKSDKAKVSRQA